MFDEICDCVGSEILYHGLNAAFGVVSNMSFFLCFFPPLFLLLVELLLSFYLCFWLWEIIYWLGLYFEFFVQEIEGKPFLLPLPFHNCNFAWHD